MLRRVLVSSARTKLDTNKYTNKSSGCSRLYVNKRERVFYDCVMFSEVSDVREHLRTGSGAQGRNRTTDTAIFSRMLYQLSYLGI